MRGAVLVFLMALAVSARAGRDHPVNVGPHPFIRIRNNGIPESNRNLKSCARPCLRALSDWPDFEALNRQPLTLYTTSYTL